MQRNRKLQSITIRKVDRWIHRNDTFRISKKNIKTVIITIVFQIKKVKESLSMLSESMEDQDRTSRDEKRNV